MSFSIQTNVSSISAQEHLRQNSIFQDQTIQRLTSGYRINQSGDDAAGLAVANSFRNNLSELGQGVRNANDGISQLQIMDGGLNNIGKMLDRLKSLATQAASDTYTGSRTTLQTEFDSVVSEINRQASNIGLTQDATAPSAWAGKLAIHVGGGTVATTTTAGSSDVTVDLTGSHVDALSLGIGTGTFGTYVTEKLDTKANADTALTNLNSAIDALGVVNGKVGTGENELQYAVNLAQSQISSYSAAESRIRDTDVAAEASNLTKAQVLQQASMAAMAQANSAPTAVMALLRG